MYCGSCWTLPLTQFSEEDGEDLSHYREQPDRLIKEFKKVRTAKKKAEQFAIEAKQSAQKVCKHYHRLSPPFAPVFWVS